MSVTLQSPVRQSHAADAHAGDIHAGERVRLTRRGRVVVLALLIGLMLAAFTVGRSGESRASTEGAVRAASVTTASPTTTVHAGETLWAVARRVNPGHDPRALVQAIRDLNHLSTAAVQAGQQLLLPRMG